MRNNHSYKMLPNDGINLIAAYSLNDIRSLRTCFKKVNGQTEGPSSAFGLYLTSLLDIWGSIATNRFGLKDHVHENVKEMLRILNIEFPTDRYQYDANNLNEIATALRHNLIHNYGLKYLQSNPGYNWREEWPNITADRSEFSIHLDHHELCAHVPGHRLCRWNLDTFRVAEDLETLIERGFWTSYNNRLQFQESVSFSITS